MSMRRRLRKFKITMELRLFPDAGLHLRRGVDHLLFFLMAVSVFFSLLIFAAIFYFAISYRRRSDTTAARSASAACRSKSCGRVIPLGLTMVMFGWGAEHLLQGKPAAG